jgi:membrane protein required for colicin V production
MAFDLIFLTIFLWAAYRGYTSGFIIQLATFAALVLGIFGAIKFSGYLNEMFLDKTSINPEYIPLITFAITFLIIVIVVHLIARILEKFIDIVALGFVNRLFGALFSIFKFALILSGILVVLNKINAKHPFLPEQKIEQSKIYSPLSKFAPSIFPYLRFEKSKEWFENFKQEVQV